jgi:hypothetical protein
MFSFLFGRNDATNSKVCMVPAYLTKIIYIVIQFITRETCSQNVLNTRYDVRGEIYLAAVKRAAEGKQVIYTNVGNPHALGEKPLTFNRQVLCLVRNTRIIFSNTSIITINLLSGYGAFAVGRSQG